MRALGGQLCFLSLVGNAGEIPRFTVSVGQAEYAATHAKELSPLLRKVRGRTQPVQTALGNQPALVLPLLAADRPIGAAVVVFTNPAQWDLDQAQAIAELAAGALEAARQIAVVQVQAEEVAERARLREIQLSRNLLRGVIDSIPMGLALMDADGTVLAANRALSDRFGLDPAALVGLHYSAAIGVWTASPAGQTFDYGVATKLRQSLLNPDGGPTLMEISSFPLLDPDDRPRQVVEVWEDITERVSLQTQLVRAEKLAAIGQLAASIAHEVGNPLQAIQGFLQLFLEQCEQGTPNRNFLELAEGEIERIVRVIARLRDLYRPRADVAAAIDMNELVDNVLLLTSKQMERHQVLVRRRLAADLPPMTCVADQIKQVLLNLVLNAIEAMKDGGVLSVTTVLQGGENQPRMIDVLVGDTGVGIAPEPLQRIFDGLHTTKELGMGLGLYTSKAIVERHMGRLRVESTVGEGTTFTISLPLES
ncbi:MAG: PAS domain-containing protein [Roseiflexaceae bacterium]|nr:PAS domain-containing protein [Roseiflexaceae bacterium]